MSQTISDIFSSQNLTRAGAVAGIFGTAQATLNSTTNNRNKAAVAGALITQLGGVINSFNRNNPKSTEGFNISTFLSTVSKLSGFVNPSHFLVYITPPKWLRSTINAKNSTFSKSLGDFGKVLPFLCSGTQLPGMSITTDSVPHFGYGVTQSRPVRARFDDITMNFYMDNTSVALDFFTKWFQKIVNFDPDAIGPKSTDGAFYGEVAYQDEYATTVDIYVFDSASARVLHVKLHEAFPINIGNVNLRWGAGSDVALLDVSFTYKSWTSNYLTPSTIDKNSLRNLSLGNALIRFGTAATTISSLIRRPTGVADIINTVRTSSSVVRYMTGG
jgi:hypothetical protein